MINKKTLKAVLTLALICLVVGLLLAVVNHYTGPVISDRLEQAKYDSLRACLGEEYKKNIIKESTVPEGASKKGVNGFYNVYDGSTRVANIVSLTVNGYAAPISMTVGVKTDGTVIGVVITDESETHGKTAAVMDAFVGSLSGKDEAGIEAVDNVSKATGTSLAIKKGVNIAIETASGAPAEEPDPNAELLECLGEGYEDKIVTELSIPEGADKSVVKYYGVYDGDSLLANIVTATVEGYKGPITMNIGIKDGKVLKAIVTEENETPGKVDADYVNSFSGKDKEGAEGVEVVSKATVTSKAIKKAVVIAIETATGTFTPVEELPRSEEELLSLMSELVADSVGFETVDISGYAGRLVKRVYKETSGLCAVAYVCTYAQYGGGLESETLIATDKDGRITAVKNLFWKVGHTVEEGAPDEIMLNIFFGGFVGKSKADIDSAELVTGATGTASNIKSAITDALTLVPVGMRSDSELIEYAMTLIPGAVGFERFNIDSYEGKLVDRIFREKSGLGAVSYVCTYAQWGGGLESETLIATDTNGKIIAVKNLFWKVGHTVEAGAPDEAALKVFFDGFVGKSKADIDSAELVTGATGTASNVQTAIKDALGLVPTGARTDTEIKAVITELSGATRLTAMDLSGYEGVFVKKGYSFKTGYAFYLNTYAQYGGTLESETVIITNKDGVITAIKNLFWKVGHTVEEGAPDDSALRDFFAGFVGKSLTDIDSVELVTGATGTARNVQGAISDALDLVPVDNRGDKALTDIAMTLIPDASGFESVSLGSYEGNLVKKIYKENSGLGFVVYVCTYAQYGGGLESETLFATDKDGNVTAVKNIFWKVGHTVEGGAPTEDAVKTFFDGFVGKSTSDIDSAELVTGATGTAANVRTAIKEGLSLIPLGVRSDSEIKNIITELVGEVELAEVSLSGYTGNLVKRIYSFDGGYAIYACTYAQYGGGLESETVFVTDSQGKITAIRNLFWKVGHSAQEGAPTEDAVKTFFDGFVGKSTSNIDSAELVTGATGTAKNVQTAISEGLNLIPRDNTQSCSGSVSYAPRIIGISLISILIIAIVLTVVFTRKRRTSV